MWYVILSSTQQTIGGPFPTLEEANLWYEEWMDRQLDDGVFTDETYPGCYIRKA